MILIEPSSGLGSCAMYNTITMLCKGMLGLLNWASKKIVQ